MENTRELILARLKELQEREGNFPKSTMRWRNVEINGVHISMLDFNKIEDAELVGLFEKVIRRFYTQM